MEINEISIKKGVRQGDTISQKLLAVCFEEILKKLGLNGKGIKIGDEYLNNLRFADDIVLSSESTNELQQLINDPNGESMEFGKRSTTEFNSNIYMYKAKRLRKRTSIYIPRATCTGKHI